MIAVQLDELKLKPQNNAFGEPINEDNISNPYTDVVAQFDDGQLAMTTNYPTSLEEALELSSKQLAENNEMASGLPKLLGRKLYAAGFSLRYQPLFEAETSLDEMLKTGPRKRLHGLDHRRMTKSGRRDSRE